MRWRRRARTGAGARAAGPVRAGRRAGARGRRLPRATAPVPTRSFASAPAPSPASVPAPAILALALCLLATACSAGQEAPEGPRSAACEAADDTLRIASGSDLTGTDIRALLIQRWGEKEGVPVEIVQLPDTADGQRSQLVASLQEGNPDCYDLVNLDVTWTAEFAAQRLVTPLGSTVSKDKGFWPAASRGVRYEGQDWAVPWNTDVGLLFYRADLIGPGELGSWEGLTDVVRRFRPQDDPQVRAGLLTQLGEYEGRTVNAAEAVWRKGGELVSGEGSGAKVRTDEPAATSGLLDLIKATGHEKDKDNPELPVVGASSWHLDEQSSLESFLSGHSLMLRDWPFAAAQLARAESRATGKDRPRYGVTQLPRDATGRSAAALGGQNLAVVAGGRHEDLARALLTHLTGTGAGRCLREGGFVPARRAALHGECEAGEYVGAATPRTALPAEFRRAYERALEAALGDARTRPVTPYYAAVTRKIQQWVDRTRRGEAQSVADELARKLRGR